MAMAGETELLYHSPQKIAAATPVIAHMLHMRTEEGGVYAQWLFSMECGRVILPHLASPHHMSLGEKVLSGPMLLEGDLTLPSYYPCSPSVFSRNDAPSVDKRCM